MVLAIYAFFRTLGGAVGLATATIRHSSASILRRIGGRTPAPQWPAGSLISRFQYSCDMEMFAIFYSWAPNPRFDWLDSGDWFRNSLDTRFYRWHARSCVVPDRLSDQSAYKVAGSDRAFGSRAVPGWHVSLRKPLRRCVTSISDRIRKSWSAHIFVTSSPTLRFEIARFSAKF